MFKDKTVIFLALLIALTAVLGALVLRYVPYEHFAVLLGLSFILFLLLFFGIVYLLNRQIYNRVEMLYKLMYAWGLNMNDVKEVSLEDIEMQIKKWSKEKKPLIQQFKAQEKFRKEFIGDVAHELKTPIFNIQGYIYTLIDGGLYDDKINKRYLRKAQKNINRMIYMVEDLDLITKLESGELEVVKKRFSLNQIIVEAMEEVEMRAMDKDIHFEFCDAEKERFAYADKEHILRVLINLIANSVKYGKKSGKTQILVKEQSSSNKYEIEIKDNGIGIKKDDLPRIFERFYRVDKSRSRNVGGSGLGLSIVKHILEVHDEIISVKSDFGEGTSFQFSLQKAPEQRTQTRT